ncbi:hypothetical protein ACFL6Y_01925 [Elusimicrobiota bacterium]
MWFLDHATDNDDKFSMKQFVYGLERFKQMRSVEGKMIYKLSSFAFRVQHSRELIECLTDDELDCLLKNLPNDPSLFLYYVTALITVVQNRGKDTVLEKRAFKNMALDTAIDVGLEKSKRKNVRPISFA